MSCPLGSSMSKGHTVLVHITTTLYAPKQMSLSLPSSHKAAAGGLAAVQLAGCQGSLNLLHSSPGKEAAGPHTSSSRRCFLAELSMILLSCAPRLPACACSAMALPVCCTEGQGLAPAACDIPACGAPAAATPTPVPPCTSTALKNAVLGRLLAPGRVGLLSKPAYPLPPAWPMLVVLRCAGRAC